MTCKYLKHGYAFIRSKFSLRNIYFEEQFHVQNPSPGSKCRAHSLNYLSERVKTHHPSAIMFANLEAEGWQSYPETKTTSLH
jgi:hypothetical protein